MAGHTATRVGGGRFLKPRRDMVWPQIYLTSDCLFNKKLTGGPAQRAALWDELEIQCSGGRMVLRPRAQWSSPRTEEMPELGTTMHPLCVRRRNVQSGPSLSYYSVTLMDFRLQS